MNVPEPWLKWAWFAVANYTVLKPWPATETERAQAAAVLVRKLRIYDEFWRAHPLYYPTALPVAMAAFEHESFQGHTESYMISSPDDLLTDRNIAWGGRTLGLFKRICPVRPDFPVDDARIGFVSWSLKGSGRAYRCRMELKTWVPRRYWPLISKARYIRRKGKQFLLDPKEWETDAYRKHTRDELGFQKWRRYMTEAEEQALAHYMDVRVFWRAATGQMHPDDIANHVTHQLELL